MGSKITLSELFFFKSLPKAENTTWSPHIVLFGDMGNVNARSLTRLQQEAQEEMYDMIIHVGDFAYDMYSVTFYHCSFIHLKFFSEISQTAARGSIADFEL